MLPSGLLAPGGGWWRQCQRSSMGLPRPQVAPGSSGGTSAHGRSGGLPPGGCGDVSVSLGWKCLCRGGVCLLCHPRPAGSPALAPSAFLGAGGGTPDTGWRRHERTRSLPPRGQPVSGSSQAPASPGLSPTGASTGGAHRLLSPSRVIRELSAKALRNLAQRAPEHSARDGRCSSPWHSAHACAWMPHPACRPPGGFPSAREPARNSLCLVRDRAHTRCPQSTGGRRAQASSWGHRSCCLPPPCRSGPDGPHRGHLDSKWRPALASRAGLARCAQDRAAVCAGDAPWSSRKGPRLPSCLFYVGWVGTWFQFRERDTSLPVP